MPTTSRQGYRYFITFIDGNSHFVRVCLMKTKDEAYGLTKAFVTRAEVETNSKVNFFRSDGGGEYESQRMADFFKSKGIQHEKTNAYTPQENGVSERMNRTVVEMARCLLHDAGLANKYWGDAVLHAAYILNRVPTRALNTNTTPYEAYTGHKPSLATLRIFGCKAYVHVPDEKRKKLDPKTLECTFLGYVEDKRAYRLVQLPTGRIVESRDVVFSEGPGTVPARITIEVDSPTAVDDTPPSVKPPSRKATVEDSSDDDDDEVATLLTAPEDTDSDTDTEPTKPQPAPTPAPAPAPAPRRSTRVRQTPVPDDDPRYDVSAYNRKTTPSAPKPASEAQNAGSVGDGERLHYSSMNEDPRSYKEAC